MTKEPLSFYTTPDKAISFFPNPSDGPHAYHVSINPNKCSMYISNGALEELTSPNHSTNDAIKNLESINGHKTSTILADAAYLQKESISPYCN
ncbi:MAG: hypothetical protein QXD13_02490 [Candidatus Pacearchaeota archaeon]